MTSLPPDLFSSPPRSLSVSSRFFPVSIRSLSVSTRASSLRPCSGLFTPPPRLLSVAALRRTAPWPVAGCTPRAAARVSRPTDRHHLQQSFPSGFPAASLPVFSGKPLGSIFCQSFGAASSVAFPVKPLGVFSVNLYGTLSCQASGQPLCQPFQSAVGQSLRSPLPASSAAIFPGRPLDPLSASPSVNLSGSLSRQASEPPLRQPFLPASPGRLSVTLSALTGFPA